MLWFFGENARSWKPNFRSVSWGCKKWGSIVHPQTSKNGGSIKHLYACMYMYMYMCIYIYIYLFLSLSLSLSLSLCLCMSLWLSLYLYLYLYLYICIYLHLCQTVCFFFWLCASVYVQRLCCSEQIQTLVQQANIEQLTNCQIELVLLAAYEDHKHQCSPTYQLYFPQTLKPRIPKIIVLVIWGALSGGSETGQS